MSNSKSNKSNAQVDEAVKANDSKIEQAAETEPKDQKVDEVVKAENSESEQTASANPEVQEVHETVKAEDSKTEENQPAKSDSEKSAVADLPEVKDAESGKKESKAAKSDEVEAKRIMLQRDVSEVYKVGEYWFTHKPYADNHSKASKQEVKTFKKQ